MHIRNLIKRSMTLAGSLSVLLAVVLLFVSCGGDYQKPSTTQTGSALITAETLKGWMASGKVNGSGYDRVIILDVTTAASYAAGHIPGSLFLDSSEIGQNREEGIALSNNEVPDGPKMDALVQKFGITGNTTIVFTGSSPMNPARAYFTFRYWGFPRNRLKVLDGVNTAWDSAYGLTTKASPKPAVSAYSVRNNSLLRDDLRVSLAEMIAYADGKAPGVIPVDVRSSDSSGSYAGVRGSTAGVFNPPPSTGKDFTVFEGRVRGAKAMFFKNLYDSATNVFIPEDQIVSSFRQIGLSDTKTAYVYCRTGYLGSIGFFVLDGILGWPAAVYDGSWSQWGQLSGNSAMKGQLDPDSPWRTDLPGRSDLIVYNYALTIGPADFNGAGLDDLTAGNGFTGSSDTIFVVKIDSAGATDTFSWSDDGGTSWTGANVPITAAAQTLSNGMTISFGAATGHTLDDSWTINVVARKNVEQYTADGTVCSATYKADGTISSSAGGTSDCKNLPNSFDTGANRIEEADKAYMNSGGSGAGSGGHGPQGC